MATEKRIEQMSAVQQEALELFRKKNTDYGDAFANYGPIGVIVRMGDKIQRLHSINTRGITMINNENLRDTLVDLHNYAAMAVMLIDEQKTKDNTRNNFLTMNMAEPKNCFLREDIHRY